MVQLKSGNAVFAINPKQIGTPAAQAAPAQAAPAQAAADPLANPLATMKKARGEMDADAAAKKAARPAAPAKVKVAAPRRKR